MVFSLLSMDILHFFPRWIFNKSQPVMDFGENELESPRQSLKISLWARKGRSFYRGTMRYNRIVNSSCWRCRMNLSTVIGVDNGLIALFIFAVVLALIVFRRFMGVEFPIWTSMMVGAALMIAAGVISVAEAYAAVDFDVLFFLVGMFSIVAGLERSGLLGYLMYRALAPAKSLRAVLVLFVFLMGALSAFTVNDTMAVVGTMIAITLVKQLALPLEVILIGLAFSITVGSVMTPIGNPQNMLIASQSGMKAPFLSFVSVLGIPTLLNLAFVAAFLWFTLRRHGARLDGREVVLIEEEHIRIHSLARVSGASLCLAVGGFVVNDLFGVLGFPHTEHLGVIAFIASVPLYVLAKEKRELLRDVDWSTIVFFVSMFIVVGGLWSSGAAKTMLGMIPAPNPVDRGGAIVNIMLVGTVLSQVFSNVPLVKLYIEVMKGLGFNGSHQYAWLALAAGSTVAGNLTVLGAASNVIIIEAAENRTGKSFTFKQFVKYGVVITAINVATYTTWLLLFA